MRIALMSDIHANLEALEACLIAAERLGAEKLAILGDLVGYGGDPGATVDRVMALHAAGALVLRGNHDDMDGDPGKDMHLAAADAARWTRTILNDQQKDFLRALPLTITDDDRLYVHADASAPGKWLYVTNAEAAARSLNAAAARVVICGHMHTPMIYMQQPSGRAAPFVPLSGKPVSLLAQRRWHVVLGSVGQPRNRDPAASFALYDTTKSEITFHRAAYDIAAAARRIREAGLPDTLAERLFEGR